MNHLIRKIDSKTGIVSTFAGTHKKLVKDVIDGSLALEANIRYPVGIAMDKDNNIFVTSSNQILKISKVEKKSRFHINLWKRVIKSNSNEWIKCMFSYYF